MASTAAERSPIHDVTLVINRGQVLSFSGQCTCGASVSRLTAAGMVAAWADEHRHPFERLQT